ncbi:MAG: beta-propeller domain-containing protein, partial [Candidatus Omnitrophota bacterium]|nr:beta-propeller domain-containing protein [Candidatus Omnitrophota bacterium]
PELKGELKIPGYSSYLHPINKDRILGMGKEGSKVKVSLFDVELASNPKEADKYILDEYWSDVLNTHHAFLLDAKHKIFFLPGHKGGYIFSYEKNRHYTRFYWIGLRRYLFSDQR